MAAFARFLTAVIVVLSFAGKAGAQEIANMSEKNAHGFSFVMNDGTEQNLSDYAGKVLLVVNTASKCGLTPQYAGLQKLHETYADKGLVVLGVPSGDFAGQEFETDEKVAEFTQEEFAVTFPLTQITHVKGEAAHPFYKWARDQAGFMGGPKWNFHKYLVGPDGRFVDGFASTTGPDSAALIAAIEGQLARIDTTGE